MPVLAQKWGYWILIYLVLAAALADTEKGWEALAWALTIGVILQTGKLELIGKVKSGRMMVLTAGMQIAAPALVFVGSTGVLGESALWYVLSMLLLAVSSYGVWRNESGLPKGMPHYGLEASIAGWFAAFYVLAAVGIASRSGVLDSRVIVLALIASVGLLCMVLLRNTRIVAVQAKGPGESPGHERVIVPDETGVNAVMRAASWPSAIVGLVMVSLLVRALILTSAGYL